MMPDPNYIPSEPGLEDPVWYADPLTWIGGLSGAAKGLVGAGIINYFRNALANSFVSKQLAAPGLINLTKAALMGGGVELSADILNDIIYDNYRNSQSINYPTYNGILNIKE